MRLKDGICCGLRPWVLQRKGAVIDAVLTSLRLKLSEEKPTTLLKLPMRMTIGQTDTSSGDWSQDTLSTAREILSHA